MIKAAITAIGGYVPDTILSNKDLEKIVNTSDEWIRTRTGIQERRILKKDGCGSSFMAIKAAEEIIQKKKIDPLTIDAVILSTITPDYPIIASATTVATTIGAHNAFAFDLSAACSGFLYGYQVACSFITSKHYKKILLIGVDKMSSILDYEDRNTCIIFGDGAGAALIEPDNKNGYHNAFLRSDGTGSQYLRAEAGGSIKPITVEALNNKEHFFKQDGKVVFKNAVLGMNDAIKQLLIQNNLTIDDIDWILPHQANIRIIESIATIGNIPMEKILVNIEKYGNTTNATIPLLLWDYEKKFNEGDTIIFVTFGGGFTWGAILLTWAY